MPSSLSLSVFCGAMMFLVIGIRLDLILFPLWFTLSREHMQALYTVFLVPMALAGLKSLLTGR